MKYTVFVSLVNVLSKEHSLMVGMSKQIGK